MKYEGEGDLVVYLIPSSTINVIIFRKKKGAATIGKYIYTK